MPPSPFLSLTADVLPVILTHLACEPLTSLSTDAYRRLLPFAVCCVDHYHLVRCLITGIRILPLRFSLRQRPRRAPIPPFPPALLRHPHPHPRNVRLPRISTQARLVHAIAAFPHLKLLHLCRTASVTDHTLAVILSSTPHLTNLKVTTNHPLTLRSLSTLSHCPRLHTLSFSFCASPAATQLPALLLQLPHLRSLSLISWPLTDQCVRVLARIPHLAHLDISTCSYPTQQSCRYLARFATALRHFHFRCAPLLDDSAVVALAGCERLETLDLSMAKSLTDSAFTSMQHRTTLPYLRTLILTYSPLLSDLAVRYISHSRTLTRIDLSYCKLITDTGAILLSQMPNLQHIDLSGCDISDVSIAHFGAMKTLTTLRVAFCNLLTDSTATYLAESPAVPFQMLDLRCCKLISQRAIAALTRCAVAVNQGERDPPPFIF